MDELPERIRRYYSGRSLPPESEERILALGRQEARRRRRQRLGLGLALAAAALVIGLGVWRWRAGPRLELADVSSAVQQFFAQPSNQLDLVTDDFQAVQVWLQRKGAPLTISLPPNLVRLRPHGCTVLSVRGEAVYLLCFELDPLATGTSPGPGKTAGTSPADDSVGMAKESLALVHLAIAPRSAFRNPPVPGAAPSVSGAGDWTFATWSRSGLVYVAATSAGAARLGSVIADAGSLKTG